MMDHIDSLVASVMKEMGCNPNKPPHWVQHIHKSIDQTTGEVFRRMPSGYICSRCGKHSWSKKEKCDGCNSIMEKGN